MGSLKSHRKQVNGFSGTIPYAFPILTAEETQTYRVSFLQSETTIHCPVEGFQGRAVDRTNLRIHFAHHHMWDTIIILEEGNFPHPCFPK